LLTKRQPPIETNDAMRSGQRLERAVLDYAAEELHTAVLPGPFVRDLQLPLAGHLDGVTADTGDLVEAKTSRTRAAWGEPGTGEIPPHIACQALHYLGLVPAARVCWIPVLFSGLEFSMFRVERDDALIEQMRNLCWRWWQDYIVTDTPPAPTTGEDALALFPRDTGRVVIADDAVAAAVVKLRDVRQMEKALEEEREALESRIKLAMGDAATLTVAGDIACTWRTTKPALRFDSAAFKLAEPEQYRAYCREQSSRRFLLKGN
jgi:predicted phage-related endonuclease